MVETAAPLVEFFSDLSDTTPSWFEPEMWSQPPHLRARMLVETVPVVGPLVSHRLARVVPSLAHAGIAAQGAQPPAGSAATVTRAAQMIRPGSK